MNKENTKEISRKQSRAAGEKARLGGEPILEQEELEEDAIVEQEQTEENLLKAFNNDKDLVQSFLRFRNKELERQNVKEIANLTKIIVDENLEIRKEYENAVEEVNKVLRKAWSLACEELKLPEEDYPCKY